MRKLCKITRFSGREEELGFTITQRKSRRNPAITETDLDFANDIALLSDGVDQVQKPLTLTESESEKAGQQLNPKKTEVIKYNSSFDTLLKTMEGKELREVQDFKYLRSLIASTENNKKARKGKASKVLNDMNIWKSNMSRGVKLSLFKATVESVLLQSGETWTLAPTKSINGWYTRMLRVALIVSWQTTPPRKIFMEICRELEIK